MGTALIEYCLAERAADSPEAAILSTRALNFLIGMSHCQQKAMGPIWQPMYLAESEIANSAHAGM